MIKENILESKKLIIGIFALLIILTLATPYYGSTDIGDYADTAKFFAGDYNAKIRSSHSYLLGFIHAPFVALFQSFIIFKISSLIFLFILIYSTYYMSERNIRVLWMILLSPVVWYMAPWINPIQLASIFLLWAWHFMNLYHTKEKIEYLIYSAILIGLGWAFWDTILYFGIILGICFLYDKKIWHGGVYLIFILIGLLPRLILDQYLFNFAFFTSIKTFLSGFANIFGGIYEKVSGHSPRTLGTILPFILAIPLLFWKMYSIQNIKEQKRSIIFITLSLILLLTNPQIRYILALAPIIILIASRNLTQKEFKINFLFSSLIILAFIFPYILQINGTVNNQLYGAEFTGILNSGVNFVPGQMSGILKEDIYAIAEDFPDSSFIVGNNPDDYQVLAHFYSGNKIKEFVSIQDYDLFIKNETILYKKRFEPIPNILERRQFWIEGGLKKNDNDSTNYRAIEYGIGLNEPIRLEGFRVIEKYDLIYLSKKV